MGGTIQRSVRQRLRDWRTSHGLTQAGLAEPLGLSGDYVRKIENGQMDPTIPAAIAIAKLTGLPLRGLVTGEQLRMIELAAALLALPRAPSAPSRRRGAAGGANSFPSGRRRGGIR